MNEPIRWSSLSEPLQATDLEQERVDIWLVDLEQTPETIHLLSGVLSGDEQIKAARFHFHRDRRRYIVARGALRLILGRYLRLVAAELHIDYTKHGKPFLPNCDLHFNVSHAHELALIAVTRRRPLGVDLEYLPRKLDNLRGMAARFFSPAENAAFLSVPQSRQHQAFFNCWTRKEAYIKAIGEGLSHPLDTFDVTLRPGESARFLRLPEEAGNSSGWSLRAFTPEKEYVAALAAMGSLEKCRFWRFVVPEMPR